MKSLAVALRQKLYLSQPVLSHMQIAIVIIGALFWIEARLQGEAFDANVFGAFAVQFPAEMWAGVMMGASAMCWIGLRDPVRRWMVATGAALQAIQYLALGYSAISTGGEMVIGLHCTVFFAPIYAVMFWEAIRDAD
jgi:hypothetical protein